MRNSPLRKFAVISILFTCISGICSSAKAETVYSFVATINKPSYYADPDLVNYYLNRYGLGQGDVINFDIAVFNDRNGSRTTDTGEIIELDDSYYAELFDISIDDRLLSQGLQQSNYFEYYQEDNCFKCGGGFYYGERISVANIYLESTTWSGDTDTSYDFMLQVNDGAGRISYFGTYELISTETIVTPIPAAAWLFLSGIGGCCIFRHKSKAL